MGGNPAEYGLIDANNGIFQGGSNQLSQILLTD